MRQAALRLSLDGIRATGSFRRVLDYLRPYAGRVAWACAALLAAALSMLAIGRALQWMIDRGVSAATADLSAGAVLALAGIVVLQAITAGVRTYLFGWVGAKVVADIRDAVFAHLLNMEPHFFDGKRSGDLVSRITVDASQIQLVLVNSAASAIQSVILIVGGTILLVSTSVYLTMILAIAVPVIIVIVGFFSGRLRVRGRTAQGEMGGLGAYLQETFLNIRVVQAFSNESLHLERMRKRVKGTFIAVAHGLRTRAFMIGALLLAIYSVLGIIIWLGGRGLSQGLISAGQLSSFVFYAAIVASAFTNLTEVLAQIFQGAGAVDRLFELKDAPPTRVLSAEPVSMPTPARGEVEFIDVTFQYPGSDAAAPALDGVSFRVASGEQVALVGPSGAGKSTIFGLLLGFFEPQRGRILVDGVDIAKATLAEVRHRLGVVPQEAVMFAGTIAQNIQYGRLDASSSEIERAADAAHLGDFVRSLPDGFDTEIGERGVRLSGGQKQRIAIARAILRDPPLLLLDEATSALDAESEKAVQLALHALSAHRTVLIIAHRLATVVGADRILVIEQGKIVGAGTHSELVASNDLYRRLSSLQFGHDASGLSESGLPRQGDA